VIATLSGELQGYQPGEIVILTPYVGQLKLIRQQLERFMTVVLSDRDLEELPEPDGEADHQVCPNILVCLALMSKPLSPAEDLCLLDQSTHFVRFAKWGSSSPGLCLKHLPDLVT
jgi:hypothetical protein